MRQEKGSITSRIMNRLDLPTETLGAVPRLTLTGGNEVFIENHRGLAGYSRELIIVNGGRKKLLIHGDGLELSNMTAEEIIIKGQILSIDID